MDARTRRVIGWEETILLRDVVFKVSEAGRSRAILEGRRNVHAFADGYVVHDGTPDLQISQEITYNPFRDTSFVDLSGIPVQWAPLVTFEYPKCYIVTCQ